ncbi:MAG: hypothetical protein AAF989_16365 [Planctomycetota bacterium]
MSPAKPDDGRDELVAKCRNDRQAMLRQWDRSCEAIIHQYEVETLAVREELNRRQRTARHRASEASQPIADDAEARRLEVLSRYDLVKSRPAQRRQEDDRVIGQAQSHAAAELNDLAASLRRRGVLIPAPQPTSQSCQKLQLPAPESIEQAVKNLESLSQQTRQLHQEFQSGITPGLVDYFLLPLMGVLLGLVLGAVSWLASSEPSPWISLAVALFLAAGGVVAHFVISMPLQRRARQLTAPFNDLHNATEHCVIQANQFAESIQKMESEELVRQRDHELNEIDAWLENEKQGVHRLESETLHQDVARFESRLTELDQAFADQMAANESMMRERAEELATKISETLRQSKDS